ncbi:hypothetical protein FWC63_03030 [Candidatus Saccharibacteria bacterium]|nr:hypothetical protein [Candidatus Saccharibacteria bacterium]
MRILKNLKFERRDLLAGIIFILYIHSLFFRDKFPGYYTVPLSIAGLALIALPYVVERFFRIRIPTPLFALYVLFVLGGIYIGDFLGFYVYVEHWDKFLHLASGVIITLFGFAVFKLLKNDKVVRRAEAGLYAFAALCVGLASAAVWEIFEFLLDFSIGSNSQRHSTPAGEPLCGQAALMDTMLDIIGAAIGSLVMALVGYVAIKRGKNWLSSFWITSTK